MKYLLTLLFATVLLTGSSYAQKDTVVVAGYFESDSTEGTLNTAINEIREAGSLSNTVFKLKPDELYVLTSTIVVDTNEVLEIVAPEPDKNQGLPPPQVLWADVNCVYYPSKTCDREIDRAYIIRSWGDVTIKNVWIRYAEMKGLQVSSTIVFEDQPGNENIEKAVFDGVIFEYGAAPPNGGGSVSIRSNHFVGIFKNSYFRNNIDLHYRYYGRALSFPYDETGWHADSILFENTTFANIGYVLMQENENYSDNVHFNHCSFINVMMFSLQSGWWKNMSVTNSVFVNPFMYGYSPAQLGHLGHPYGGITSIAPVDSFGFEVDFTDFDRQILISNNSYVYEDWLIDWMANNPYSQELKEYDEEDRIPHPVPYLNAPTLAFFDSTDADGNKMFPHMNLENMHVGSDPGFRTPPTAQDSINIFLLAKWSSSEDQDWSYKPEAGLNRNWPLPEDLAYSNDILLSAGMNEYPLGDLNWFPEEKQTWETQQAQEWERISTWLKTGTDPGVIVTSEPAYFHPSGYELEQNYPNPFNPGTQFTYFVPEASVIQLKVYDTLGREVATLVNGRKQAGKHIVTFNATGLSSGVYYYRLSAKDGAVSLVKKFTLIK